MTSTRRNTNPRLHVWILDNANPCNKHSLQHYSQRSPNHFGFKIPLKISDREETTAAAASDHEAN